LEDRFGHRVRLEIEPGRYLTAESGYVVTEVRAVKRQGSRKYLLVDAGFNTLARPVLYGSYHPMSLCPAAGSTADSSAASATEEVAVGGPLCESGDIFTQTDGGFVASRALPPAQVGDLLVIEIAGAYGFVMASNYNSKPLPAEVLIDGGTARLVRARQTPEDLVRGETV
jgi:diaminopimelate decarboxylase